MARLQIIPATARNPFAARRRRLVTVLAPADLDHERVEAIAAASGRRIVSSSTALALSVAGTALFPFANAIALGLLLYAAVFPFRRAAAGLQRGKPNGYLLTSASFVLLLMTGNLPVAAMIQLLANASILTTARAKGETSTRIVQMFRQHPRTVRVETPALTDGTATEDAPPTKEVMFTALQAGDTVVVMGGEMIPADGRVTRGSGLVDQRALTGESQLVGVQAGDEVFAMTTLSSGRIAILVERAGDETLVAQIGDILNDSLATKASAELWVEEVVNRSIMPTLLVSAFLLPTFGLLATTAFIVAHPKMKGAILVSISALNYFYIFSDQRILVKDARALDYLQRIDTVVFDKTGTLTTDTLQVAAIHAHDPYEPDDLLRFAASAEQHQQHPIAAALLGAARKARVALHDATDVRYRGGLGISAIVNGHRVQIGSARFLEQERIVIGEAAEGFTDTNHSLVFLAVDGAFAGTIELRAVIRPEAAAVIGELQAMGIDDILIISGDRAATTRRLADQLGISEYYAETLPQDKAEIIEALIAEGRTVCYVGDGINDTIALSKAHVSVSLSGASHAAVDTARIVLMDADLRQLLTLLSMGRQYRQNSVQILGVVLGTSGAAMAVALFPIGLAAAVLANAVGFVGGLALALRPLRDYQRQQLPPAVTLPPAD